MGSDRVERTDRGMSVRTSRGTLAVEAMTPTIIRVVGKDADTIPSAGEHSPLIVDEPREGVSISTIIDDDNVSVRTERVRVDVAIPSGRITWRDANDGSRIAGQPTDDTWSIRRVNPAELATDGDLATPRDSTNRIGYSWRFPLAFRDDEAILGLGQHEGGVANYRGQSQLLYQGNTKVAMPAFLTTRGYGILWDSSSISAFHDDQHGSFIWTECADALDLYFVYGPQPDSVIAGFRHLTGRATMAPKWSYGYIQSKERYETAAELVSVVEEYRDREIPLDCIVQDWQYWPDTGPDDPDFETWGGPAGDWGQWGQKSFHSDRYPDPRGMIEELHHRGAHLMISIWPNALAGNNYEEFRDAGHLIADDHVDAPENEQRYYNVFSKDARAMYWRQAKEGLFDHGVDAWWCDSTEPYDPDWTYPVTREPARRAQHTTEQLKAAIDPGYLNAYSIYQAKGMYEGQRSVTDEKRVLNLTRSGSPGQQRYGAITWSGDVEASWERYRNQIADGLQFTATGNPKWTLDIGGFFVHDGSTWIQAGRFDDGVDDLGYRELYVRWLQFATFLPMMRSHGTDTPREVWRFGEPGEVPYDTIKRFIEFRYRLFPYTYSLAGQETHRNATMFRHLALSFPDDERVHGIGDQFLFGPQLMVCPVTEPMYYGPDSTPVSDTVDVASWNRSDGAEDREVYLPAGVPWYDFWTGRRYDGGQTILSDAPLTRLPLFVRAGSVLPLGPVLQTTTEGGDDPWTLRVYPGRDGTFEIYEDAGDNYDYETGRCAFTSVEWDDDAATLTIGDRLGSFPELLEEREVRIVVVDEDVATGIDESQPQAQVDYTGSAVSISEFN